MKALKLLVPLCLSCSLFANENNVSFDSYISEYKQQTFSYDYLKNEKESLKLRDSWIAPIELNYSYTKSNPEGQKLTSQTASLRINQPIFRSGGIYYGIKFAQASKYYSDYSVDVAKRKMIKDAVMLLMQIKQTQLKEKKQQLLIDNSKINLAQKKEQYLNGQLDSGFLDNAIIQRNIVIATLYDIQTAKEKLISRFEALSDLDYEKAKIPHLQTISLEQFLQHNIVLQMNHSQIQKNNYAKGVTVAKYLPSVTFSAGYNWNDTQQYFGSGAGVISNSSNYYDYGLRVNLPFNINTFRDIESAKVDYLKSQVVQKDKERELRALYTQVMNNIDNFDKKIGLSYENMQLYTKLLEDTKNLFAAGYKTEYDVNTLQNSLQIQKIDTKIYEIDKQLELLTLYEMYIKYGGK